MAQLHQARLPAQFQHLQEQAGQCSQVVLPEVGDGTEVRRVVGRQHPEGDVLVETKSNPARGRHSDAVAVDQDLDHHPGMVGRAAPLFALIAGHDGGQIQLVDHVGDEVGQMVRGQPLLKRYRQRNCWSGS